MVKFNFETNPAHNISNIIFDLGGVLFNIDYELTAKEFIKLGIKNFDSIYSQMSQHNIFDLFEKGQISSAEFRTEINRYSKLDLSPKQVDNAWNAMLRGLPDKTIQFIENIGKYFKLFMLSNTNEIHIEKFYEMILEYNGIENLDCYFDKIYLSHLIGARKPEPGAYNIILEENNLKPSDCLFIDDSPQHVQGALNLGIHSIWLNPGMQVTDLFELYD